MTRFKRIIIVILIIPLLASTCIHTKALKKYGIKIKNSTANDIYCVPEFAIERYNGNSRQIKENISANSNHFYLKSNQTDEMFHLSLCNKKEWERCVEKDTLVLYIYDKEILNNPDKEIVPVKRLRYTYDDIIKSGCRIEIH